MNISGSDDQLNELAKALGQGLHDKEWMLATAESCTGGWVAKTLTDIVGSSAWFERGFVSYSNHSKHELLGVPEDIIAEHGAVSEATVRAMASGALQHSHAQLSLAITGIAGPSGGTPYKPVGTVWFAWASQQHPVLSETRIFGGDRDAIRRQAVATALQGAMSYLDQFE